MCPASSTCCRWPWWFVAVGSLVTLVQRVVTVRRESAEAEAAADRETQGSEAAQ
ncbi:hypothetical protein SFUMM280S_05011 [Streptomyces fumanus]